ncbi:MAG: ribonuclease E/G [Candidatus Shikimatogenerans bostrichidophilus]|nr:MAG: ribonuclease E/G [Candidatus Shikimatogenerans bostrichidophilus]
MIRNLIIQKERNINKIALLENNRLTEYYKIKYKSVYQGNIYLAKIIYIYKGMNSIFLDIGYYKYGFLNYSDIGNYFLSFRKKKIIYNKIKGDNVNNIFKIGQYIIVQVIKDVVYNKGPKLTCSIKIVGKSIILLPYIKYIYISKKNNYKIINKFFLPKYFGLIIRTLSYNISIKKIKLEIYILLKIWYKIINKIKKKKIIKIYSNNNLINNILKNNRNNYDLIISNSLNVCKKISYYLYLFNYNLVNILKHYKNKKISIFKKFNINKQKKILFGKYIYLKDGTNIIIEKTETLNIIDINSNMLNKNYAIKVNLLAIKEIIRQIILRNMGGLIIIDLIDIKNNNKELIYKYIKKKMRIDNVKYKILPPSEFNLIQISREKNYNSVINNSYNNYNYLIDIRKYINKIEKTLNYIISNKIIINKKIYLYVNPILSSFLKYGIYSYRFKWYLNYKIWILIYPIYNFKIFEYKIKF